MDKSRKEAIMTLLSAFEAIEKGLPGGNVSQLIRWSSITRLSKALKTILRGEFNPEDWEYFESSKGHMSDGPDENFFSAWEMCPQGSRFSLCFFEDSHTVRTVAIGGYHSITMTLERGYPGIEIICDGLKSEHAWGDEGNYLPRLKNAIPWAIEELRAERRERRIKAIILAANDKK